MSMPATRIGGTQKRCHHCESSHSHYCGALGTNLPSAQSMAMNAMGNFWSLLCAGSTRHPCRLPREASCQSPVTCLGVARAMHQLDLVRTRYAVHTSGARQFSSTASLTRATQSVRLEVSLPPESRKGPTRTLFGCLHARPALCNKRTVINNGFVRTMRLVGDNKVTNFFA
jgi:hypothetical protein